MNGNTHAMDEDEVDDFLYGSDTSENNYGTTSKSANKKNIEEDEEIYQQYNEDLANRTSTIPETTIKGVASVTEKEEAMNEDQQDEEDSDDDLDIILEADDDDHSVDEQQLSSQKSQGVSNESTKSNDTLVNIKLGQQTKNASQGNDTTNQSSAASGNKSSGGGNGIDVDKVGEYNGQPITDVDLEIFEDKPWRKPGADITDYFNFGFNELSWKAYCAKQKSMRDKKNTGKDDMAMPDFMSGIGEMPDFMKMGMMMPMMEGDMPMGMMEGGMPMGMPMGMMNPMMGMPPPPHRHQPMNGPPMGNPSMGNTSSRSTGNQGDRGGQGNQNYGGTSGGHGHSYSRGQRR